MRQYNEDFVNLLKREIEQLQKDSKAQQEVIDKLVAGYKEIFTVFPACNGWHFDDADEIAEKAKALINSIGVDDE